MYSHSSHSISEQWAAYMNDEFPSLTLFNDFIPVNLVTGEPCIHRISKNILDDYIVLIAGKYPAVYSLDLDVVGNITPIKTTWRWKLIKTGDYAPLKDTGLSYVQYTHAASRAYTETQELFDPVIGNRPDIKTVNKLIKLITGDKTELINISNGESKLFDRLTTTNGLRRSVTVDHNGVLTNYFPVESTPAEHNIARLLGQIILWYRVKPHYGELWWEHELNSITSPVTAHTALRILSQLDLHGAFDKKLTGCIRCGSENPGFWKDFTSVKGPYCGCASTE